jgi:acyl-CoA hydrolase
MCKIRLVKNRVAFIRVCFLGDTIYLHHAASTPVDLLHALARYAKSAQLKNIRTSHALLLGDVVFGTDESIYGNLKEYNLNQANFLEHIRPCCYFISPSTRAAVNDGRADYIPMFLSQTGRLYDDKRIKVDVAFMNLSPPDEHGFCSLGVSVDSRSF